MLTGIIVFYDKIFYIKSQFLKNWDTKKFSVYVVVQSPSRVPSLCDPMDCSTPGLPVPHHLPEFAQVHVHCITDAIQPSHPLMPCSPLASIFASIRDFSNEFTSDDQNTGASASASALQVNIQGWSCLKLTGLISCVQGTFRSLLQHHSLKASIFWCSDFFTVQLSQPYTTWLYRPLLAVASLKNTI